MISKISENGYDENSVFNRLFEDRRSGTIESPGRRLERIFETAKAPDEHINVADFLPIY